MLIVKCDGNKKDNKNYFFCFFKYELFIFSVCTILRTIHPIYLSLFSLFDWEERVLFILPEQREGDE